MCKKIILGTVQFGLNYGINNSLGKPSEKKVFEMLEFATQQGITIVDTAEAYGNAIKLIGKFNMNYAKSVVVNTKFVKSEISLKRQLEVSLESLHVNKVNTYFYHSFEEFKQNPDLLDQLVALKNGQLIENIGLSVYDNLELLTAIESEYIDVIQLPFNLLDNYSQKGELLNQAKIQGKTIQIRSVFLQGLFFMSLNEIPPKLTKLVPYLKEIHDIAHKNDVSIEQLALQYAIQQPSIDYVIIGVDNIEQLKRNIDLINNQGSTDPIQLIDEIYVEETSLLYPKNWN